MRHTALTEEGGKERTCGVTQGRKRVVVTEKPAVQGSRGELGRSCRSREERVPKKNISGRQRLFHFLIEN